jgi:hypothetical protein
MEAIELKNILIHEINSISDIYFLQTIQSLIEAKSGKKVIRLTPEQKNEIYASQKEVEQGLFVDNDDLDKEINEWLSGK